MDISSILQNHYKDDNSWENAKQLVDNHLPISHNHWNFFRNAWNSQLNLRDIIKILGFSKLGAESLLLAAGRDSNSNNIDIHTIEEAINYLGIRYCAVILAANYTCELLYKINPSLAWQKILEEMGCYLEIGYKLGLREAGIEPEGGVLLGYASRISYALFAVDQPTNLQELLLLQDSGDIRLFEREHFKCTRDQVAAFIIQKLGFGTSMAVATALGLGRFPLEQLSASNDKEILAFRATVLWIDALRTGRGYPAEKSVREFFQNLIPPKDRNSKNTTLEVLYTEVAKIRSQGSQWKWHYPKKFRNDILV